MYEHAGVFEEETYKRMVYQSWKILETKDKNLLKSGARSSVIIGDHQHKFSITKFTSKLFYLFTFTFSQWESLNEVRLFKELIIKCSWI